MILSGRHVTKKFGDLVALDSVDFGVEKGEILSIIGPNGSGKTTLFNCITGIYRPDEGEILFKKENITGRSPYRICLSGLSRTFQITHLFPDLTCLDNLLLSIQEHRGNLFSRLFHLDESEERRKAEEILEFLGIDGLKRDPAGSLSYGQQKLLELGTVLIPDPEVVLLDEPAGGVNPTLIKRIMDRIVQLNKKGITFVIVEHNMDVVMNYSTRVMVLDHGKKIAEGLPQEIKENEEVIRAYFGG
ncbi:MAG: ABC transporter ATP-binding protein [Theionarchaea archaeon]|nr:ABC transporter ATP-binding protein [Theionarchaea archaeon]